MPVGAGLSSWIKKYLQTHGFSLDEAALSELGGRFGEEYDLWQIVSELEKLMLYCAAEKHISQASVRRTVSVNLNYDVFALTNALAEGKDKEAIAVLDHLMEEGGAQKSQAIQIIGALSSQLHSFLAVKNLTGNPEEKAEALGWKPGRVWINEKLAKKFATPKLKQLLFDLKQIDLRAKTSDEPIQLLLTLFIQKASPVST